MISRIGKPLLLLIIISCSSGSNDNLAVKEKEGGAAIPNASLIEMLEAAKWVDLSYTYDTSTIYWPTEAGFKLNVASAGFTDNGYYYAANSFTSAEHGGTHLDAPIHFSAGKQTADQIPIDRLAARAVKIDVSANIEPDYQISVADIETFEQAHGRLEDGTIILFSTGYGQYWPDRQQYMGTELRGTEGVANLHFPGIHPDAAKWLVENRNIGAVGIDTPSIDYGQSSDFATHQVLFGQNIPAFENVANLDQLPSDEFYVIALPMKIGGGSGGPLRIVAVIP
jgi:kynurenine formamidase